MENLKEIFSFDENHVKRNVLMENKFNYKIKACFNHLFDNNRIPINKLNADNSFDFSKLKHYEGKNYHWFFLTNDILTILVRKYSTHFTFFTKLKEEDDYFERICVFTISLDRDMIEGELSDKFIYDHFLLIVDLLPNLVALLSDRNSQSLWNNYSFPRPKYVKVENIYDGGEHVTNLDLFLFACAEIFNIFSEFYAENEMFEKIKTLKVGDKFGTSYTIKEIKTKLKDGYYHGVGIVYLNERSNGTVEERWCDVYSLTRYYYDDLKKMI